MSEHRDLRTVKTERALKNALFEMLDSAPMESITVKALTEHAEVARATFYQYYDSLSDMFASIESDLLQTYVDGIKDISVHTSRFEDFLKEAITYTISDTVRVAPFAKLMYSNKLKTRNLEKCIAALETETIKKMPDKYPANTKELLVKYNLYGCLAVLSDWVVDGMSSYSAEELADRLFPLASSNL